jgi:hypothetical protein
MGSGNTRRQLKRSGRQAFRPDRHTYQDYIRTGQPHIVISTSRADRSCGRKLSIVRAMGLIRLGDPLARGTGEFVLLEASVTFYKVAQ